MNVYTFVNQFGDSRLSLILLLEHTLKVEDIRLDGNGLSDMDMDLITHHPTITALALINMHRITETT
ncbi:hypothetical protein BC941DRAFT_438287 [Chlamydoabsidia padenii]|nr:hypothetical protein BC941DRAFT_438287 [Chlamydoabsidia padenii]